MHQSLQATLQAKGHSWKDFAVAGGGGDSAMTVLKSRVVSGNAPAAAQIKGPSLQEWAQEGVLADMSDVAATNQWDKLLLTVVGNIMKFKGKYVAVPVNVHRVNWLWANPEAFKKAGDKVPTNWDEFFAAAEKLKAAGIIPVAHGGQNWQDFTTFESVALGVGGVDFYKKALVQLDPVTLTGPTMEKVLTTFKRIKDYTDKNAPGRDWNLATAMVINGKAGMQFMGDWAKGEFAQAKQEAGKDYGCTFGFGPNAPYIVQGDVMVFPKTTKPDQVKAQQLLASVITQPATQVAFSQKKGSIPIRTDVDVSKMDICAQAGVAAMKDKSRQLGNGEIYITPDQNGALQDVLTSYWNRNMPVEKVQKDIVSALR